MNADAIRGAKYGEKKRTVQKRKLAARHRVLNAMTKSKSPNVDTSLKRGLPMMERLMMAMGAAKQEQQAKKDNYQQHQAR